MKRLLILFIISICTIHSYCQHKISGHVIYACVNSVPLDSTTVYLIQNNVQIAQAPVNIYGYYHFDNVQDGVYSVTATTAKKWGGVNSTDAFTVLLHFLKVDTLTGLQKIAANVDNIPHLNSMDCYLISRRFIMGINSFPLSDWILETKNLTVAGQNSTVDIYALCRGDADASFNPPSSFSCGNSLIDSRDGQSYNTVQIGNQCWMSENLNVGTFIYGVGNQENNNVIEKYCYSNIISHCTNFGALYQWREMMQYDTTPGIQGICPEGWHIPANAEWGILINQYGGSSVAGIPLQPGGISGFNALLGGWVYNCSKFRQMNYQGYYWSSTQYYGLYGMGWMFTLQTGSITNPYKSKDDGMYVRCVKD